MENKNNKEDKNKKGFRLGNMLFILLIAIIVTYFGSTFIKSCYKKYTTSEISYSEFLDMIHMNELLNSTNIEFMSIYRTFVAKEDFLNNWKNHRKSIAF